MLIPPLLDGIENFEDYQPGGYHPISIGDTFDHGRYRILHKLGFGGSSTVWLARDQWEGGDQGKIVALKAMRSDVSSFNTPSEVSELAITQKLKTSFPGSADFLTVDHHFFVQGPNGSHLFLIFPLAGSNIFTMYESPGRISGSRRLRADLARKVARQVATAIYRMHCAGIVHGDLTTSNILFRLSPHVIEWSDAEVYAHLGAPKTATLARIDGKPTGPHTPAVIVKPVDNHKMSDAKLLQESILISDFGQSYLVASPPPAYEPATVINYQSPEARFEERTGVETDVWSLACAIFEIRAGFPLFEPFLTSDAYILKQMIQMLGRLPDPWWDAFKEHDRWFEEDGQPKSLQDQERAGIKLPAKKTSIKERLYRIGYVGDPPSKDEGPMMEKYGTRLSEEEVELLEDLLGKMLKYSPEERIRMEDVIKHPWFMFRG